MTREEALRQLDEPLVVRPDGRAVLVLGALVGLVLGLYLGLIVAAGVSVFSTIGKPQALIIGGVCGLLAVSVCALGLWRSIRGYALVCDAVGLTQYRFGQALWFVPWEQLRLEGYGLTNARLRIVLPDGRRAALVVPFAGKTREARRLSAILAAFGVERPERRVNWVKMAIWSIVGSAVGFPLVSLGDGMVHRVLNDPNRATPPTFAEVAPGIAVLVFGGLGVSVLMITLLLAQASVLSAVYRSKGSEHGPLWVDYVRDHAREIPAVSMADGVRYRYLDPRRLRTHVQVVLPLVFVAAILALMPWAAPRGGPDEDVLRVLRVAMPALVLLPFLFQRWERRLKATMRDTYWLERGRLFVERDGRRASFPATPVRTAKGLPERREPFFMKWWEEFENENGRIRIDRRFLWPLD